MAIADSPNGAYERKVFAVPDAVADDSWKARATAFVKVPQAVSAVIISDQDLTLRFGEDPNNDPIPVTVAQFPFVWTGLFKDILITNASGFVANLQIILR